MSKSLLFHTCKNSSPTDIFLLYSLIGFFLGRKEDLVLRLSEYYEGQTEGGNEGSPNSVGEDYSPEAEGSPEQFEDNDYEEQPEVILPKVTSQFGCHQIACKGWCQKYVFQPEATTGAGPLQM